MLKFSPHLKSVAALPCETLNVTGESHTQVCCPHFIHIRLM